MNILLKASFGLLALAALTQAGSAHATGMIDVTPTVTAPAAGSNAPYQYSYDVTPNTGNSFAENSLDFQFSDPSVLYVSNTGPLDMVTSADPGIFHAATSNPGGIPITDSFFFLDSIQSLGGSASGPLSPGSTETFVFTSFNGPQGTLSVTGTNTGGVPDFAAPIVGPAAVPEASTTVSFGLLLALGVGGAAVASRKKKLAV